MAARFIVASPITVNQNAKVVIGSSSVQCSCIIIQADPLNTGNLYFGDSNVNSASAFSIRPGEKENVGYDLVFGNNTLLTLASVYLSSDTDGNVARVGYFQVN